MDFSEDLSLIYEPHVSEHYKNPFFMLDDKEVRDNLIKVYGIDSQQYIDDFEDDLRNTTMCSQFNIDFGSACIAVMTGKRIMVYDMASCNFFLMDEKTTKSSSLYIFQVMTFQKC